MSCPGVHAGVTMRPQEDCPHRVAARVPATRLTGESAMLKVCCVKSIPPFLQDGSIRRGSAAQQYLHQLESSQLVQRSGLCGRNHRLRRHTIIHAVYKINQHMSQFLSHAATRNRVHDLAPRLLALF
jgi:hypothetical protein